MPGPHHGHQSLLWPTVPPQAAWTAKPPLASPISLAAAFACFLGMWGPGRQHQPPAQGEGPFSASPRPRGVRAEPPPAGKGSWGCRAPCTCPWGSAEPPQCPQEQGCSGVRHEWGPCLQPAPTITRRRCRLSTLGFGQQFYLLLLWGQQRAGPRWGQGRPRGCFCRDTLLWVLPATQVPHALAAGCRGRTMSSVWGSPGLPGPPACPARPAVPSLLGTLHSPDGDSPRQPKGNFIQQPKRAAESSSELRSSPSWR